MLLNQNTPAPAPGQAAAVCPHCGGGFVLQGVRVAAPAFQFGGVVSPSEVRALVERNQAAMVAANRAAQAGAGGSGTAPAG